MGSKLGEEFERSHLVNYHPGTPHQQALESLYTRKRDEILLRKLLEDLETKSLEEVIETIQERGF